MPEEESAAIFETTPEQLERIATDFHQVLYRHFMGVNFMGVLALKSPMDMWVYQEILFERRPDLIIETGSHRGGSALFLACMCDILDHGQVISVDIAHEFELPMHPRISWLKGDSTAEVVVNEIAMYRADATTAMVILDSNHKRGHVLRELGLYAPFVSLGDYLIVEDTNVNGHPVFPDHGPGPWEAVEVFLRKHDGEFAIDVAREKYIVSFNPGGYLVRVK